MAKNRTTAYRRHKRYAAINRKKNIIRDAWRGEWHCKYDGSLSKGKIHCSCPMCRSKSYDQARMSDIRVADRMLDQLEEYNLVNSGAELAIRHRVKRTRSFQGWRRPEIHAA